MTLLSFLPPHVDHSSGERAAWAAVRTGLAVVGLRFGRDLGRLAASIAIGINSILLLLTLAMSIANRGTILRYWSR